MMTESKFSRFMWALIAYIATGMGSYIMIEAHYAILPGRNDLSFTADLLLSLFFLALGLVSAVGLALTEVEEDAF